MTLAYRLVLMLSGAILGATIEAELMRETPGIEYLFRLFLFVVMFGALLVDMVMTRNKSAQAKNELNHP